MRRSGSPLGARIGSRLVGGGGGITVHSVEAVAFLARTSGLDATHTAAYYTLIDWLVSKGVFSLLDILRIYATQDSTTAKLNLVSSSYGAVLFGSGITFVADSGFDNTPNGTGWIDGSFNPSTASSPKYVLNSAHQSLWPLTNISTANHWCGASGPPYSIVSPRLSNLVISAINDGTGVSVASSDGRGHFLGNRTSSVATGVSKNGSLIASSGALASTSMPNRNLYELGVNSGGSPVGQPFRSAMYSAGAGMTSTQITDFYTGLRAFMTTVGVP